MNVVGFQSLDTFIDELREECESISDKIVRWEVARTPEQQECVSFEVCVWATAIRKGGDEPYLMEYGIKVGCDDPASLDGTRQAGLQRARLAEACDDLGLKLRAGKIEVF